MGDETKELPPLPILGGGWSPQEWLRSKATQDRKVAANMRAHEAEAIAAWIDRVVNG